MTAPKKRLSEPEFDTLVYDLIHLPKRLHAPPHQAVQALQKAAHLLQDELAAEKEAKADEQAKADHVVKLLREMVAKSPTFGFAANAILREAGLT